MLGGNRFSLRLAFALALSLLLHLSLGALFVSRFPRRFAERPIVIAIFGGRGAAPPAAGSENHAAGSDAKETPATSTRPARRPALRAKRAPRLRPPPSTAPPAAIDPMPMRASAETPALAEQPSPVDSGTDAVRRSTAPDVRSQPKARRGEGVEGAGNQPRADTAAPGAHGSGFAVSGAGAGASGRSYASIWNWTQQYLSGLRGAYDRELRNHPRLHGVLVVRYEILASGAVGDVAVLSTELQAPRLERGVVRQIREWRYPPEPRGSVVVTWPFSFEPPS